MRIFRHQVALAAAAACLLLGTANASEDDSHDSHDGNETATWSYAAAFELTAGDYTFTLSKVDGAYAEESVLMALLAHDEEHADMHAIEENEDHASEIFDGDEGVESDLEGFTPMLPGDFLYHVDLNADAYTTLVPMQIASDGVYVLFAEHGLSEFEGSVHWLKDASGADIEPEAEETLDEDGDHDHDSHDSHDSDEEEEEHGEDNDGTVIAAALIVNLMTLVGVVAFVPAAGSFIQGRENLFTAVASSFAGGALMACAAFLLMVESSHLIGTDFDEEVDTVWRWGTCLLAGYILPPICEALATNLGVTAMMMGSSTITDADTTTANGGVEMGNKGAIVASSNAADLSSSTAVVPNNAKQSCLSSEEKCRIVSACLIGDLFHNFADGIFIAVAFNSCGSSFGWTVATSTIFHEFAQEVGDFFLLTTQAGISTGKALLLNFTAGLSVIIGAGVALAVDISDASCGYILIFGAGTYIYLAATEAMPFAIKNTPTAQNKVVALFAFIFACVAIGLCLLDHEHCVAEGDGHDGHGH